jgi:uncharacterized membrane-anchored protein YitT (DUF2179 family)
MLGTGLGSVFIGGGSTGGTDILAKIVNLKFPSLAMGTSVLVLDFVIIVAFAVRFGIEQALYSLITVFLSSRVIDFVIEGTVSAKAYYIISSQHKKITDRIQNELNRGVTALSATGMYSGEEKYVLLCLVNRFEAGAIKRIVRQCDKHAFVFVSDAREVLGEGFTADREGVEVRLLKQIKERLRKKK